MKDVLITIWVLFVISAMVFLIWHELSPRESKQVETTKTEVTRQSNLLVPGIPKCL